MTPSQKPAWRSIGTSRANTPSCCIEAGAIRLVDLRSRNGTRLDGKPVVGEVPLPVGMPFVVGRTILRVTRA